MRVQHRASKSIYCLDKLRDSVPSREALSNTSLITRPVRPIKHQPALLASVLSPGFSSHQAWNGALGGLVHSGRQQMLMWPEHLLLSILPSSVGTETPAVACSKKRLSEHPGTGRNC